MAWNTLPDANQPKEAQWLSPTELQIMWGDGHVSRYRTDYLREQCPCAWCKAEQQKDPRARDLLQPKPTAAALASPGVEAVGRYAVSLIWGDGHSTGIYAFEYLRRICPCDTCKVEAQRAR